MTDPTPSNGQPPATAMTAPAPRPLIELPETDGGAINAFASEAHFVSAQRMATALAKSSLVPESYRDNVPNVLIAMELAEVRYLQRQILVAVRCRVVDKQMRRAIHSLERVFLFLHFQAEHMLLVVLPVAGCLPELAAQNVRR